MIHTIGCCGRGRCRHCRVSSFQMMKGLELEGGQWSSLLLHVHIVEIALMSTPCQICSWKPLVALNRVLVQLADWLSHEWHRNTLPMIWRMPCHILQIVSGMYGTICPCS